MSQISHPAGARPIPRSTSFLTGLAPAPRISRYGRFWINTPAPIGARSGLVRDANRSLPRFGERLPAVAVRLGELGAEKKDLGRVVDPYQDDDQRARGAVGRGHVAAADVKAD